MGVISKMASAVWSGYGLGMKLGILGLVSVVGGTWFLLSHVMHSAGGLTATAVLVERIEECNAEFHPKGQDRRKEAMPCAQAYAFQAVAGQSKVKVEKKTFSLLRFPLADGSFHLAKVREFDVRASTVPVGSELAVVYNPQNPNDARAPLTFASVKFYLGLIAIGLAGMVMMLIPRILHFVRGAAADRGRAPERDGKTPAAAWGEEALGRAIAAREGRAIGATRPGERTAEARPRAVAGARRQFGVRT